MSDKFELVSPEDVPAEAFHRKEQTYRGLANALRQLAVGEVLRMPAKARGGVSYVSHRVDVRVTTSVVGEWCYVKRLPDTKEGDR